MSPAVKMKVAVLAAPQKPFRIEERPMPIPKAHEVLVRIIASGVNPLDTKIRAGAAAHAKHPLPAILGMDLAGVIEAVGSDVKAFVRGDEVYGLTGGVGGVQGSLAEYAAVDARLLAKKPANLSFREAASLPLVVITAWEGLVDRAHVSAGQSVLVHGGAGGVGRIVMQLAQAYGAHPFAIDTRTSDVATYVAEHTGGRGFDVIYDTVGGAALDASFQAVRRFGHVVSALGWGTHSLAPLSFRAATYSGVFTLLPLITGEGREHHGEILRDAAKLIEAGKITASVDPRKFTLENVADAYEAIQNRTAKGKLVVDISS